jgi:pantoate--beta-alanine ligase
MIIVRTVTELRDAIRGARVRGTPVSLVPTMGAFHEGHLSLMRRASEEGGLTVVSLFVNPAQFNDPSDLERYPRDEARDARMADSAGADILFAPPVSQVYPPGFLSSVEVRGVSAPLEGAVRGVEHFRGVATVVTKLFNMVQPDIAFFGQKDAQQALLIRRLVRDLDMPVRVEVCPTVREGDGLAMSSRNVLLAPADRERAPALYRALVAVERAVAGGAHAPDEALAAGGKVLSDAGIAPEYFAAVSADSLAPVRRITGETLIAIAARFGAVRLIDNVIVRPAAQRG